MPEIARGIIPAGKRLLPLIFLLVIGAPLAAKADNGIVDVRTLPRLEGAVEDTSRTQSYSMSYAVPTVVAVTSAATKKLLAADGWVQFLRPLDEKSSLLTFKKAQQGLNVHFTQGLGRLKIRRLCVSFPPPRSLSSWPRTSRPPRRARCARTTCIR